MHSLNSRPITVQARTTSLLLDSAGGEVVWWSWRETTAAAGASFRLWDGSTNAGNFMAVTTLLSNESIRDEWPWKGLPYYTGLFLEVLSGSIEGVVHVRPFNDYEGGAMPVVVIGSVTVDVSAGGNIDL